MVCAASFLLCLFFLHLWGNNANNFFVQPPFQILLFFFFWPLALMALPKFRFFLEESPYGGCQRRTAEVLRVSHDYRRIGDSRVSKKHIPANRLWFSPSSPTDCTFGQPVYCDSYTYIHRYIGGIYLYCSPERTTLCTSCRHLFWRVFLCARCWRSYKRPDSPHQRL